MIRASFQKHPDGFRAVTLQGHADYADGNADGGDIVCAAVTSAFQLCANGITEILGESAEVTAEGDSAGIRLLEPSGSASRAFLSALYLHLSLLQEEYPENIETTITEV